MSNEYSFQHVRMPCPECKHTRYTVYDSHHAEVYCMKCGTVIIDTTIFSIVHHDEIERQKEKFIRNLWKTK